MGFEVIGYIATFFSTGDIPLIATNTLTSCFQVIILFMIFKEKDKSNEKG